MTNTPPTDRPLTAGDVPLLREGDVLKCIKGSSEAPAIATGEIVTFIRPSGSGGISKCIVTSADEAFGYRPGRFTFVSRPATSAASERERLARAVYAKRPSWMIHPDNRALTWEEAAEDAPDRVACIYRDVDAIQAALASPPVSERERELEGEVVRLREAGLGIYTYANDTLSGRVDGPDDRAWQRACVVEVRNLARTFLTAQPAGEPTHG